MIKLDKKTIVFGSVLLCILLFTLAYTVLVWTEDTEERTIENVPKNPNIPALKDPENGFDSRREAVDQLKEKKPSTVPSLYDEIEETSDSLPYETTIHAQQQKDNIYSNEEMRNQQGWTMDSWSFQEQAEDTLSAVEIPSTATGNVSLEKRLKSDTDSSAISKSRQQEIRLRQEALFSYNHVNTHIAENTMISPIPVAVSKTQKVQSNSRVELYLLREIQFKGNVYPAFTPIYGFVSLGPNRVFLRITNIKGDPVSLSAYDLQDGNEGIYVVNNFRAEASREILDDVIQDINIPSVPQVGGLKNLFRKHNRNIKVTIANHYRLFLKP
ncbi:conjugative transposon protein TraM [Zunongwangia endophytica]|uniref:Conjugative transposon protein TraM n=1 Tax=Zunongwangia endophytica TaxID=1808945 RepID=A0ABV8HCG1_9FLAO|nr:conjugative transposon protein TraM [Zunongwangia endophytica]MDN3594370.1 conjugative transposon protein TraM [Zunongwangia endophytica]